MSVLQTINTLNQMGLGIVSAGFRLMAQFKDEACTVEMRVEEYMPFDLARWLGQREGSLLALYRCHQVVPGGCMQWTILATDPNRMEVVYRHTPRSRAAIVGQRAYVTLTRATPARAFGVHAESCGLRLGLATSVVDVAAAQQQQTRA